MSRNLLSVNFGVRAFISFILEEGRHFLLVLLLLHLSLGFLFEVLTLSSLLLGLGFFDFLRFRHGFIGISSRSSLVAGPFDDLLLDFYDLVFYFILDSQVDSGIVGKASFRL